MTNSAHRALPCSPCGWRSAPHSCSWYSWSAGRRKPSNTRQHTGSNPHRERADWACRSALSRYQRIICASCSLSHDHIISSSSLSHKQFQQSPCISGVRPQRNLLLQIPLSLSQNTFPPQPEAAQNTDTAWGLPRGVPFSGHSPALR